MMRQLIMTMALLLSASILVAPALAQQNLITTTIGGGPSNMPALNANLSSPVAIAVDSVGNYYIAASVQNRVFKVNTSGFLTVVAGNGLPGYSGDGVSGGAANAMLSSPQGVTADSAGNVYISDTSNCVVRKVDTTNTITTIAGVQALCGFNGNGSPATSFHVSSPVGLAVDGSGNLYIADAGNNLIRKLILSTGVISSYAGTGISGFSGDGGPAASAQLAFPAGVAVDAANNVFIADTSNLRIRRVSSSTGKISTIAGDGVNGFSGDGGPAALAEFSFVFQLAVNSAGNSVTIADYNNQRIRQFTVGGNINTIGGSGGVTFCGDGGPAISACLYYPIGVAVSSSGGVYVADSNNQRVRQFTVGGNINTVAGNGSTTVPTPSNGVPPQGVVLYNPWGVLGDPSGNTFVSEPSNCMVRESVLSAGLVNFFAGNGTCGYTGDGGPSTSAQLQNPSGVARDSSGNIYTADQYNCVIRQTNSSGVISTFAGNGACGYSGDGGLATNATLYYPNGVSVDSQNNVYIADTYNHVIRKVTGGIIRTIAGNHIAGYSGDGGPAVAASLYYPYGVTVDASSNVYVADTYSNRVRVVKAATGAISTIAGNGFSGFTGDGVATQNSIYYPTDVKVDINGNLFLSDTGNNRLRWVSPGGMMTTFAGNGLPGYSGDGGPAIAAALYQPSGLFVDPAGNFLVSDQFNYRVRSINAFAGLGASATSLSFGLVSVGSTSTPQTIALSGVGPLTINSILVTGAFSEYDNCGTSLSNGQTCTVYVYYKPTASGTQTGALTINHNGYFGLSTTIPLQGSGSAISITGGPVVFAAQMVRTTSAAKNVTVANRGKTAVTMGTISLTQTADFAISANTCPPSGGTLAANATCTIGLTFTPQGTGVKKGALVIADSDPSSPQLVGYTGTGTSNVTFAPAAVTFAAPQAIGTTSAATKITLTNKTGVTITLGTPAISLSGPFAKLPATTCTDNLPVANNGTCVIYVTFSPTAGGYVTGALTVSDSDSTSPQTLALAGTGTGIRFTPAALNVGSAPLGSQISANFTITNVGPTTVNIMAATLTGTNSADFRVSPATLPCGGVLAPAATCTVTAYFTPTVRAKEAAVYQLYDSSPGSPQSLSLSGTGQ